jgi:hypothetical protein
MKRRTLSGDRVCVLRRRSGPIVGSLAILGLFLLGFFGALKMINERGSDDLPILLGILIPAMRLIWRALGRPRVELYESCLIVVGPLLKYEVPLRGVGGFDQTRGLEIEMVTGGTVPVFAFSGSLIDMGRTSEAVRSIRAVLPRERAAVGVVKKLDYNALDLVFLAIFLPVFLAPW